MNKEHLELMKNILESSEKEILKVVAMGAHTGDYATIRTSEKTAAAIRSILNGLLDESDSQEYGRAAYRRLPTTSSYRPADSTNLSSKSQYVIKNSTLNRIGTSRKNQEQKWVHKIPKITYETVVSAISELARSSEGNVNSTELRQYLDSLESRFPAYQISGVIGFLVSKNTIHQSTKGNYFVESNIAQIATQVWRETERESS